MRWPWEAKTSDPLIISSAPVADRLEDVSARVTASAKDLKDIVEKLRIEVGEEQW